MYGGTGIGWSEEDCVCVPVCVLMSVHVCMHAHIHIG